MKFTVIAGAAALVMAAFASQAMTITFDDIPDTGGGTLIGSYDGFAWSNFYALNSADYGPGGYANGTVSPPNIAYNGYGTLASISAAATPTFNLMSGDFTAAWNNGLTITVDGYNGANLVDTTTFVVDTTGPSFETFGWTGLTEVTFLGSGGTNAGYHGNGEHFALDNLSVSVPEPAAWALLLGGFAGLGAALRLTREKRGLSAA